MCGSCGEEWPFDDEFWHLRDGKLHPAWLPRCIACCAEYAAERRRTHQRITRHNRREIAPKFGRCGASMRMHQRCGRKVGHRNGHRSVAVMRTETERKREGRAA